MPSHMSLQVSNIYIWVITIITIVHGFMCYNVCIQFGLSHVCMITALMMTNKWFVPFTPVFYLMFCKVTFEWERFVTFITFKFTCYSVNISVCQKCIRCGQSLLTVDTSNLLPTLDRPLLSHYSFALEIYKDYENTITSCKWIRVYYRYCFHDTCGI